MKLDGNIHRFLDALTDQLHEYIHHPDFKETLLQKVATSWRLKIGFDVNDQIERGTKKWEETHVNQIYKDIFVKNLNDKLKSICGPLAKHLMRGFQMPYDPDNKILKGILHSTVSIVGGFAIRAALFEPPVAVGLAVTGVIFAGLLNFGYTSDFKTVCKQAVDVRITNLSKTKIKTKLTQSYSRAIKTNMVKALKTMKCEIEKLREETEKRDTENTINTSRMGIFMSLDKTVFECKHHFQKIEKMCS